MKYKPQQVLFFKDFEEADRVMRSHFRGTPFAVASLTVGWNIFIHDFAPIEVGTSPSEEECQTVYELWLQRQP